MVLAFSNSATISAQYKFGAKKLNYSSTSKADPLNEIMFQLSRTSSFLTISIRDTPTKILETLHL